MVSSVSRVLCLAARNTFDKQTLQCVEGAGQRGGGVERGPRAGDGLALLQTMATLKASKP